MNIVDGRNPKGEIGQSLVPDPKGEIGQRLVPRAKGKIGQSPVAPMEGAELDDQRVQTGARWPKSPTPRFSARQRAPAADGTHLAMAAVIYPLSW